MQIAALRFGLIVSALVLLLDQLSKYWVLQVYSLPEKISVEILPFFSLTMVWNKGISLGLFQAGSGFARWALVGLTVIVTVALIIWLARTHTRLVQVALGLVIGGAIGNIIDRIKFGAVVDFIHLHAFDYSFYVFNIADSAISIGVGLLLLDAFIAGRQDKKDKGTVDA